MMASLDAMKISTATAASANSGSGAGGSAAAALADSDTAGSITAGIAPPAALAAGADAASGTGMAGPKRLLPGQNTQPSTPELFSQLLSAQRAAPTASAGAKAAGTAETTQPEQAVDIATLLGELAGFKPSGATQATGLTKVATLPARADKDSAVKQDDEQEFEVAQSTVLDVQALLRLLEGPLATLPKAPNASTSGDGAALAVSAQGKAPAASLSAELANTATGTAAAAPAATAAAGAMAAATAAPVPAVSEQTAQLTTDANGTSLVMSQTLTTPTTGTDASAAPVTVERSISVPVGHRDWSPAVAAHVLWQVKTDVQSARVHLTPEGLGPVEVHIDVDGKQVSVNFTAAHVETRQALEQSVPQLRELLAGSGLTLGQTSVQQQGTRQDNSTGAANAAGERDADHSSEEIALPTVLGRRGLVDEYA